ncbi:alpha-ketoacid dehydrogenase subunit beta [Chloroflexota bacterium]
MPTVLESLNKALHTALESDERVYILGEDVLDPYGGAFKVTRGLSTAFPHRTLTTPVSEAGFLGVAAGMALRGLRPVVEIMFGDFITLIADQVINHVAKFRYMYNEQIRVPLVIRAPMGGRRGYGPTHSQTLEKLFMGTPGIHVLAPCTLGDPGQLLGQAIFDEEDPVLFIENKLLYSQPVLGDKDLVEFNITKHNSHPLINAELPEGIYAPAYHLTLSGAPNPSVTLAAYGYMADLCRQAVLQLAYQNEIFTDLVVLTHLSPFEINPIIKSVGLTHRLLVVEEGTYTMGWGAEIIARTVESLGPELFAAARVAGKDVPIPASGPLEKAVLPDVEDIIQAVKKMV